MSGVKAEHGGNNVALAVGAGGTEVLAEVLAELLADHTMIEKVDDSNRFFEIRLQPGADPQALLRTIVAAGVPVQRFELVQPSLHQMSSRKSAPPVWSQE